MRLENGVINIIFLEKHQKLKNILMKNGRKYKNGGFRLMVRPYTVDVEMSVRFCQATLRHKQQLFLSLTVNQMNRIVSSFIGVSPKG